MLQKKIAVFGTGPAGLAVGWAALRKNYRVRFFSKDFNKSVLNGCQYLHAEIPGIPDRYKVECCDINYRLVGTVDGYRRKVYGPEYDGTVSPMELSGIHKAWDIRATYNALWDLIIDSPYIDRITQADISHEWIAETWHYMMQGRYDMVISTIPAPALCNGKHAFTSRKIRAVGYELPAEQQNIMSEVVCDGTMDNSWYRQASVFGYRTIEWPGYEDVVHNKVVTVRKPVSHECTCYPDIIRLGRYGAWRKGILVHHVFQEAERIFQRW